MNFADAIRLAAKTASETAEPKLAAPAFSTDFQMESESMTENTKPTTGEPTNADVAFDAVTAEPVNVPTPPNSFVGSGNIVRLELFLGPEQLNQLFRSLVATQHTMYTLREAANYLRVQSSTVENMAHEGFLPGILIEGRWRFPKSALDEWMSSEAFKKGEQNAA